MGVPMVAAGSISVRPVSVPRGAISVMCVRGPAAVVASAFVRMMVFRMGVIHVHLLRLAQCPVASTEPGTLYRHTNGRLRNQAACRRSAEGHRSQYVHGVATVTMKGQPGGRTCRLHTTTSRKRIELRALWSVLGAG